MAEFNITTATHRSSSTTSGLRSANVLGEAELVNREALLLGAPIALLVFAVSSMCCIILLRWKIKDRLRRRAAYTSDEDSIIDASSQLQTAEEDGVNFSSFANTVLPSSHLDGVVIRLLVTSDGRTVTQTPYRPDLPTTDPPPSYDVAVIYSGYRLNHAYDPSHSTTESSHSTADDLSATSRPPTYNDAISRPVPDLAVNRVYDCTGVSIT